MGLIELILILAIVGVILWAVNRFIPMDPTFKQILNVVVLIVILVWVLSLLVGGISVPRVG